MFILITLIIAIIFTFNLLFKDDTKLRGSDKYTSNGYVDGNQYTSKHRSIDCEYQIPSYNNCSHN